MFHALRQPKQYLLSIRPIMTGTSHFPYSILKGGRAAWTRVGAVSRRSHGSPPPKARADAVREASMETRIGLWIDHRKAVVVALADQGEETTLTLVVSRVEKQLGRSAGVRSTTRYEALQVPADDRRQRKLTTQLNIYYDAVVASLRDAQAILLFGPGEAKGEVKKRLERNNLGTRIVGIETIDKMTDRQIAAKVRRHFGQDSRARAQRSKRRAGDQQPQRRRPVAGRSTKARLTSRAD